MHLLKLIGFCVLGIVIISLAWLFIKPASIIYRDTVAVDMGASRMLAFQVQKSFTWLSFSHLDLTINSLRNGTPVPLSNFKAGPVTSEESPGGNQILTVRLSTPPYLYPGTYPLCAVLAKGNKEIAVLPFNLVINEAPDDVVQSIQGPAYRGDVSYQMGGPLLPVTETTVFLGDRKLPVTYRNSLEMGRDDYRAVLVNLNYAGTALTGQQFSGTIGLMRDGQFQPLSAGAPEVNVSNYENFTYADRGLSVLVIGITDIKAPAGTVLDLAIRIDAGGSVVGYLPLTVKVLSLPDDLNTRTAGTYLYTGSVSQTSETVPFLIFFK